MVEIIDLITDRIVAKSVEVSILSSLVIIWFYELVCRKQPGRICYVEVFLFAKPLFNEIYILSNAKISSWYVGVYSFSDILYIGR